MRSSASVKKIWVDVGPLMKRSKRLGTSMEPWRTLAFSGNGWDRTTLTRTEMVHLLRKYDFHEARAGWYPNEDHLDRIPSCQTRAKALEKSSETVSPWLLSSADQECDMTAGRSPVDQRERYPYW